jgi:hypothetical protein
MYVDALGGRDIPEPGWYLQAIGRTGKPNTAYLVADSSTRKANTNNAFRDNSVIKNIRLSE